MVALTAGSLDRGGACHYLQLLFESRVGLGGGGFWSGEAAAALGAGGLPTTEVVIGLLLQSSSLVLVTPRVNAAAKFFSRELVLIGRLIQNALDGLG